ncbi:MAG: prolipoprotein diacylglyceryl transferase [Candidatus Omnitrophota bacterium]
MHRILFEIGPFTVYSYGLTVAAGFLLSSVMVLYDSEKFGLSKDSVFDCLIAILAGGIIGGRLLFVAINWQEYAQHPVRIFMLTEGGMAFHGSLAGAVICGGAVARIKKLPFWKTADLVAPYIALGQAVGRIGCLLNGCCYGKAIIGGMGIVFPGETIMRVPTQIYSSVFLLFLYVVLIELRQRRKFDGFVFSMYVIFYAAFRFFIEFYRGDTPPVFFDLTLAQIISIAMFICGLIMLWKKSAVRNEGTEVYDRR